MSNLTVARQRVKSIFEISNKHTGAPAERISAHAAQAIQNLNEAVLDSAKMKVEIQSLLNQRNSLLASLERIMNTAAPEWEIESGMPGYDVACYEARCLVKNIKSGM